VQLIHMQTPILPVKSFSSRVSRCHSHCAEQENTVRETSASDGDSDLSDTTDDGKISMPRDPFHKF
jgi:hypothetical protein